MKIVFFGSANFSIPSLKALLENGYQVVCVVTQPDKQKGRGLNLSATTVKTFAKESRLEVYQPININAQECVSSLKGLHADIFVVIAYGQLLSPEILSLPAIMPLNAHASILPKYRGAAPINWALINGDKKTGVSIMKIIAQVDAGAVIAQRPLDILGDDNFLTLEARLAKLAAELLLVAIKDIANSKHKLTPQDESKVTFAPKLKKDNGLIDWNKSAQDIYNLIRGSLIWPGAFTYFKSKLLKIYKAQVCDTRSDKANAKPGEIIGISKQGILVATSCGGLLIEELQLEGKRKMSAEEFINGHKIKAGEKLTKNRTFLPCNNTN
ncbi:methionyl-tRNA formyltransferase [bacterium]|nr:MAG: methionyl-tRNA formyltransferase [bacterium]